MAEGGRGHQRDRLDQVGADELRGLQLGVEQKEHDDDQRPRAHRRHADDEASDDADEQRRQRADDHRRAVVGHAGRVGLQVALDGPAAEVEEGPGEVVAGGDARGQLLAAVAGHLVGGDLGAVQEERLGRLH